MELFIVCTIILLGVAFYMALNAMRRSDQARNLTKTLASKLERINKEMASLSAELRGVDVKKLPGRMSDLEDRIFKLTEELRRLSGSFYRGEDFLPGDIQKTHSPVSQREAEKVPQRPESIGTVESLAPSPILREAAVLPPPIPETSKQAVPPVKPGPLLPSLPTRIPIPPRPEPAPLPESWIDSIDWEIFTGKKLFAWMGGVALFLALSFFVKFSIEHSLISPALRIIIGLLVGFACIIGGLRIQRPRYTITAQTLSAAGVAILYSSIYAAHAFYHFLEAPLTMLSLTAVTLLAMSLAAHLDSRYVALLGFVGGFLTPPMLAAGEDRPLSLFGYITLLDAGLLGVALYKRWGFLLALAAGGTILTQIGWLARFFVANKELTAYAILLFFPLFFAAALLLGEKQKREMPLLSHSTCGLLLFSILPSFFFLSFPPISQVPHFLWIFLFLLNGATALLALGRPRFSLIHGISGSLVFLVLIEWTNDGLTQSNLLSGLAACLAFAILHAAYPILLKMKSPESRPFLFGGLLPMAMLIPMTGALLSDATHPALAWTFILLVNGVVLAVAFSTATFWISIPALLLTVVSTWTWIFKLSPASSPEPLVAVSGLFFLLFFGVGCYSLRRFRPVNQEADQAGRGNLPLQTDATQLRNLLLLPSLAALLPFLLLVSATLHLSLSSPVSIFSLGLFLTVMLLGLAAWTGCGELNLINMAAAGLLLYTWQLSRANPLLPWVEPGWLLVFFVIFLVFPFLFHRRFANPMFPYSASALAGPVFGGIFYIWIQAAFHPYWIGLLPFFLGLVYLAAFDRLRKNLPTIGMQGNTLPALFGAIILLFFSLIFPLQFEKEWITLGWALEGMALFWLFRRIPHPGLKYWGSGLLAIAFVRLALNPAVWDYYPRSGVRILNWYLYTYGIGALSFFVAALGWRPAKDQLSKLPIKAICSALGTVLLFLLLNIEIADYFSEGSTLIFEFSGNLARDMSYSLAWTGFAFLLLVVGLWEKSKMARWGGLGLLMTAAAKVFLHDLWRLGQLYRIGSLVGLAVFLIVVSYVYQRYLGSGNQEKP